MKACFHFCAKSHRGVSRGCHIGSPKGCRHGTQQSEQSSDNMTYPKQMKACFRFARKSHRGVSRGSHINIPQGCCRGTRLSEQSSDNINYYLSCAAATPGSSLPSRNSREAPPPVEIWLILSPNPIWFTAAAESPPPIIVVASISARA